MKEDASPRHQLKLARPYWFHALQVAEGFVLPSTQQASPNKNVTINRLTAAVSPVPGSFQQKRVYIQKLLWLPGFSFSKLQFFFFKSS